MNNKVGILGGSFNPIHLGHILMCQYAYEELNLDKVYLLPNENPPHKTNKNMLSGIDRLKMCQISAENNGFLDTLDYEINNLSTNYSINTLKTLLNGKLKGKEIYFIIGADSLMNFETWKDYTEIFKLVKLVCIERTEFKKKEIENKISEFNDKFGAEILVIKMPLIQISSTDIRKRILNNKSVKYMIDGDVLKYINKMNYYR
ncbi:nicotinate (nicotinamide) nucleotide adenylyltransferase [Clostridiaceae bacterium HSG29]|nr:nicotinate (nicotinamide) nucleotide adenylyltransferase [Clostridiaceae bacterium HSG29]